jgi:CRISPR-associated endonuclease/helicase Cas3
MPSDIPLAKSGETHPVPLDEHVIAVARYARAIVDAYRQHWQRILGDEWAERLEIALVVAALAHDLGKTAEGFQRALRDRETRWEFRHEVLSAALMLAAAQSNDETMRLAIAAVLTHHRHLHDPQLCGDSGLVALPEPDIVQQAAAKFRAKAQEMESYWRWLCEFWQSQTELRTLPPPASPGCLRTPTDFLDQLQRRLQDLSPFQDSQATALLLARGWLMAADHAVSAGIAEFKTALPTPFFPQLRPFQNRMGECVGDSLLEAPTGCGKTQAALLWALRNRRHGERVFYLLPYQASIEAMATTLERQFGGEQVAVLHARALDYAFREYFERTGEYDTAYAEAKGENELNRLVHKPLKVATPFQLLKWLFGVPRFEIGVSEMVGGLFIFDEIHAYDAHVVALIIEMVQVLKQLGGRCLFMTATFPPFLKGMLQNAMGTKVMALDLTGADPDEWTRRFLSQTRHRLRLHDATLEALRPAIVQAARDGQRVLVVANRVGQAQEIYQELRRNVAGVRLLHSRFARRDRVAKEHAILSALQDRRGSDLRVLVATQVIEVSLDVSFDTIFTEVAPVDDLLQRFGRVNRYGEHPDGVDVHVARQFNAKGLGSVYDLERVNSTLAEAPESGTSLHVEAASAWVREVYRTGWTQKENQRYMQAQGAFRSVLQSLRPLQHHAQEDDDFAGLFMSVEVLSRDLRNEYDRYIKAKQYLLATQLLAPIPASRFHSLERAGRIVWLSDGVPMADIGYDPEFGLLSQSPVR